MANSCATTYGSLVSRRNENGSVDMVFDGYVEGVGALHIEDAGNDGKLLGPNDRTFLEFGGNYGGGFCERESYGSRVTDAERLEYYEKIFDQAKRDIVQNYVGEIIGEIIGATSISRFHELLNGTLYGLTCQHNPSEIAGTATRLLSQRWHPICRNSHNGLETLIDIDSETYPEAMELVNAAISSATQLFSAIDRHLFNMSDIRFRNMMCFTFGRLCDAESYGEFERPWRQLDVGIDTVTNSCSWSAAIFAKLEHWATLHQESVCVDIPDERFGPGQYEFRRGMKKAYHSEIAAALAY